MSKKLVIVESPAKARTIGGYLGSGDVFDRAVTEFAVNYADQNDEDYAAFVGAIESGRIESQQD